MWRKKGRIVLLVEGEHSIDCNVMERFVDPWAGMGL